MHHLLVKTSACALVVSPSLRYTAREAIDLIKPDELSVALHQSAHVSALLNGSEQAVRDDSNTRLTEPGYNLGADDTNVLLLHSSGTTGLPKPVYTSHTHLMSFANCHEFENQEEAEKLTFSTLPLYHVSFSLFLLSSSNLTWWVI